MTESEIMEMVNGLLPEGYELGVNFDQFARDESRMSVQLFFAPDGFDSIKNDLASWDPIWDPAPARGPSYRHLITWDDVTDFLFGTNTRSLPWENARSFFECLDYRRKNSGVPHGNSDLGEPTVSSGFGHIIAYLIDSLVSRHPWVFSLAGCSSVEEIELKMAVMGIENVSRKTLGIKE